MMAVTHDFALLRDSTEKQGGLESSPADCNRH